MCDHNRVKFAAPRVRYEFDMLRWTFQELLEASEEGCFPTVEDTFSDGKEGHLVIGSATSSGRGDPILNAVLECFLLHARVLRDFLDKRDNSRHRVDDILASDFLDQPFDFDSPNPLEFLRREPIKPRLDKALAHLSYQRIEYERDKLWDIERIFVSLNAGWVHFITMLPEDRRGWFSTEFDDCAFDNLRNWLSQRLDAGR